MKKKILFVGLGSAGQRHLRNIYREYGDSFEYSAFRSIGDQAVYSDSMQIIPDAKLSETYGIKEYNDYDIALADGQDIVFVCNPNHKHLDSAIKAVNAGADVFVEKPLSSNMDRLEELKELTQKKGSIVYVGYQQRLHPCIKYTKDIIDAGNYGDVIEAYFEIGEDVTKMHPERDYRTLVETRSDRGGGVVTCQCHEIDCILYLLGFPSVVVSMGGRKGKLEMDVENTATSLFGYKNNGVNYTISLHQDYFQWPAKKSFRIVFERATINVDLIKAIVSINKNDGENRIEEYPEFKRNDMFLEEEKLFFEAVENRTKPFVTLNDGIENLIIIKAIKDSISKMEIIEL